MKQADVRNLAPGLYRLFWKAGGSSLAAVGALHDGYRWFAVTDHAITVPAKAGSTSWKLVDRVERIA